jgi:hypothetical protein
MIIAIATILCGSIFLDARVLAWGGKKYPRSAQIAFLLSVKWIFILLALYRRLWFDSFQYIPSVASLFPWLPYGVCLAAYGFAVGFGICREQTVRRKKVISLFAALSAAVAIATLWAVVQLLRTLPSRGMFLT